MLGCGLIQRGTYYQFIALGWGIVGKGAYSRGANSSIYGRREIGLYLAAVSEQSFLEYEVTLATFMFSGSIPDRNDLFIF